MKNLKGKMEKKVEQTEKSGQTGLSGAPIVQKSGEESGPPTPLFDPRILDAREEETEFGYPETPTVADEATKAFNLLQDRIKTLVKFVLQKNNIHKELKEMARASDKALSQYKKVRLASQRAGEAAEGVSRASQTSPIFRSGPEKVGMQSRSPPLPLEQPQAKKLRTGARDKTPAEPVTQATTTTATEWSTVVKKAKKKKKKSQSQDRQSATVAKEGKPEANKPKPKIALRAPRPDAIKIKASAEVSYADLLRKVKATPELKSLGDRVTKIRRTRAGELLLELGHAGEEALALEKKVSATLQKSANVQLLTQKEALTIRDVDETTTEAEIAEAVTTVAGQCEFPPGSIKLRGAYGGTQVATVLLPALVARKLLQSGKLRVGWVNCRVRIRDTPPRCYRCLETGHFAGDCKSEVDRSKQCFWCGQEGHKAATCAAKNRGASAMTRALGRNG